jgi:hypothetical protein
MPLTRMKWLASHSNKENIITKRQNVVLSNTMKSNKTTVDLFSTLWTYQRGGIINLNITINENWNDCFKNLLHRFIHVYGSWETLNIANIYLSISKMNDIYIFITVCFKEML